MIIKTFIKPPIENNNYLIIDEETKKAALVDCSSFDNEIINSLEEQKAELEYILLTHGHFDHIMGINNLLEYFDEKNIKRPIIYIHKEDIRQMELSNQYLSYLEMPGIKIPKADKYIEDNEIIKLGNTIIKVIHTPGHTQGSVCYLAGNDLFSGDTIFRECVGRCDLEGGDFTQIVESIKSRIFTLPDDVKIYPGHGSFTTVGWEKINNNFT